jgi:hypothetical protein
MPPRNAVGRIGRALVSYRMAYEADALRDTSLLGFGRSIQGSLLILSGRDALSRH